ncbi:MarR family transcriptional regulator [Pseudomonas cavernae]|uniref:MarR family transcriptional regulator n=1 Tax=Pseudomonas cavernae TaxID=2320867 RepID=A0A385Z6I4_9PSED|nr:MarR family transcriptional regulator [Pseudomonas cavernae]AYC34865.1 MarR family transcriptional regulator [Pseudomonas cavernae]
MTRRYSQSNRRAVAAAIIQMDESWIALFSDIGLSDLCYCDLFTHMWLRREQSLRKTDLYTYMPSISRRTAVKYVQQLIDQQLLEECSADNDKRVRWVTLTVPVSERLERFYDQAFENYSRLGKV